MVEQARAAALKFVGGADQLPPPPSLPLTIHPDFAAGARIADVAILLGIIGLLFAVGRLLQTAVPQVRPVVFAASVMGVLMFTVINPLFWQLASVTVDETGVVVARYTVGDLRLDWADLTEVGVDEGAPLPYVQDDRALRLVDAQGGYVDIPRYLPRAAELAAAVVAAVESPPN
jgi:hypothetical protein